MTNQKNVSVYLEGNEKPKAFSVPMKWGDRQTVSHMIQAFDNFAETEAGVEVIIKNFYKADYDEHLIRNDLSKPSPIEESTGWFILLNYMPDSFFNEVGIQMLKEQPIDLHIIKMTAVEQDTLLDGERLNIIKTIGNYHIIKRFIPGTPGNPTTDEETYHRWEFEFEYGTIEDNGYVRYDTRIVDVTKPYQNPYELFVSVEEAEEFIRSNTDGQVTG